MNEYKREEYSQLAPGLPVRDSDGVEHGTIGSTVGDYVEIRGGDQTSSMWIRSSDFGESEREAALLGFPGAELGERAVAEPPAMPEDTPEARRLAEDGDRTRESMLAELAEQREEMHETGSATEAADRTVGTPVEVELEQRGVS